MRSIHSRTDLTERLLEELSKVFGISVPTFTRPFRRCRTTPSRPQKFQTKPLRELIFVLSILTQAADNRFRITLG